MPDLPHLRRNATGRVELIVDGRPLKLIGGEFHNSASSCLEHAAKVFARYRALCCNAALVPVTWELLEPDEGRFDFDLVDGLLALARGHGMRLVPLWFGTFKNAHSSYAPAWVKTDQRRFPRAELASCKSTGAVSVLCDEVLRCDARAFAALMAHLRDVDAVHRTVVMVQVENEVGVLGTPRDRCPAAERAFAQPLPAELLAGLDRRRAVLHPDLAAALAAPSGTWSEVFGRMADEAFMAWHFARFVDAVAAAGGAEYDLPCFANAWLVQHACEKPGEYPSGGPVARMRDIWRVAAPHIDALAPDIYLPEFAAVCAEYSAAGEPLLIPEARRDVHAAARAWYAFGRHDALCYAPFGLESIGGQQDAAPDGAVAIGAPEAECTPEQVRLLADSYALLQGLLPDVDACLGSGRSIGILQDDRNAQSFELGGFRVRITFNKPYDLQSAAAGGLIASPADGEFIVAGFGFRADFATLPGNDANVDFLEIWEGTYVDGKWVHGRRLNGDEYAVRLGGEPTVRRVKLCTFP